MDPDGTNVVQLTDLYGMRDPAWSPNRRHLAISDINGNITVIDVEHETVTVLTDDAFYEIHPAWSPDGERLAFLAEIEQEHWSITLLNADGTGRTAFDLPPNITGALVHNYGGLTWSPDGNYLALVTDVGLAYDAATDYFEAQQIYLVNVHDCLIEGAEVEVIQLTRHVNECPAGEFYFNPTWSLETNQLAFSMSCGGGDNNIYVMDMTALETGELPIPFNLTQNCPFEWMGVVDLAWSPDGNHIAFIAPEEVQEHSYEIFVLDIAAPDPCDPEVLIQLTDTPEDHVLKGLTW